MEQMTTWSCLIHEILSLIVSHLSAGDKVVFRLVCKWWKATPRPIAPLTLSPLVGSLHNDQSFLLLPKNKLFHPIYGYSHYTQVCELPKAFIRGSHCGWLLMTQSKHHIFFFNPFTKEKVELPDMPFDYYDWPNLTFSSQPTSLDCLVFGVQWRSGIGHTNMIDIYFIKVGQTKWTCNSFNCRSNFNLASCSPIMFKGLHYCLGTGGSLLIYDCLRKLHRWVGPPAPPLQRNQSLLGCQYYMVESEGKLLLVFTSREGEWVNVVRYTIRRRIWEKVVDIGDTMLFVSRVVSFSSTKSVENGTGNKIYFPMFLGDNHLFYSLTTHKYHCFDEICSLESFDGTRWYPNSTWIKPWHSS